VATMTFVDYRSFRGRWGTDGGQWDGGAARRWWCRRSRGRVAGGGLSQRGEGREEDGLRMDEEDGSALGGGWVELEGRVT
jgi:hypothetical protein